MKPALVSAYRYHRRGLPEVRHYPSRMGTPPTAVPHSAVAALAFARADVAKGTPRYDSTDYGPGTRQRRREDSAAWVKDEPEMFALHGDTGQGAFRFVGNVESEWPRHGGGWFTRDSRDHGGWYTDPYGDVMKDGTGLCWGVVYQMPGHKGTTRFVAGYQYGGMDEGVTLDLSRVFEAPRGGDSWNTDPKDHDAAQKAARYANGLAENAAEEEREWQSASAAGYRWREAGEEAEKARADALALLAERRRAKLATIDDESERGWSEAASAFPALCDAIRSKVSAAVETIREARELRRKLAAGEGDGSDREALSFWPRSPRLACAFNDAAGTLVIVKA